MVRAHDRAIRTADGALQVTITALTGLPERRISAEVAVHGDSGSVEELETDPSLEAGIAELPVDVRRGTRAAERTVKGQLHSWFDRP